MKSLQVRASQLKDILSNLGDEQRRVNQEINNRRNELSAVNQKIAGLTEREPVVTEHALLRYCERVLGIDMQKITESILSPDNRAKIKFAKSCTLTMGDVKFVVKDGAVVSVVCG
jgi:hypothetical protein